MPPVICFETPFFHSLAAPKSSCGAPTLTPSCANVSSADLEPVRGLHPGLRGDAADAQARAAELWLLLDADGLRAQLRCADCGRVAARPAPEDGDVAFHASILSTRFWVAVLSEIALFTDDVDALVDFYRRVLGREPTASWPGGATFDLDGATLLVHVKR